MTGTSLLESSDCLSNNLVGDKELEEILHGIDADKNGAINYTEFVAATLDQERHASGQDRIKDAFDAFDRNNDGAIDKHEVRELMLYTDQDGKLLLWPKSCLE